MAFSPLTLNQVLVLSKNVGEIRAALDSVTALAAPTAAGPADLALPEVRARWVDSVAKDATPAVDALERFTTDFAALLCAVGNDPGTHHGPGMLRGALRRELRETRFACETAMRRCKHVQGLSRDVDAEGDAAPCRPMQMIERALDVLHEKFVMASERLTSLDVEYSPLVTGPAGSGCAGVSPALLRVIASFEKSREDKASAAAAPRTESKE
jgi:hypothetical protein